MIIYIHGFASSGMGAKAQAFGDYYAKQNIPFIAPSLPVAPALAIDTLETLIQAYPSTETIALIGSSLGGFYATYLAEKYQLNAVLINPAVKPFALLTSQVGLVANHYDGAKFEWRQSYVESLKRFDVAEIKGANRFKVLLQKGDEVLDYRFAEQKFSQANLVVEPDGNHSFDAIERHFDCITSFLMGKVTS